MKFKLDRYMIRRKMLTILGASFHVYDHEDQVVGFTRQKAFKLREDIRVYTDESKSKELLSVKARQIVDFKAAYDIVDPEQNKKIGAARRKGWSSIFRDAWELLDEDDNVVAKLQEDSAMKATLRRFLSNLIPQSYHLTSSDGAELATMRVRFNPFIYKLMVNVKSDAAIDRRVVFGMAVLVAAIEGRQQ